MLIVCVSHACAAATLQDILDEAGRRPRPQRIWFEIASTVESTSDGMAITSSTSEETLISDGRAIRHDWRGRRQGYASHNVQAWDGRVLYFENHVQEGPYRHVPLVVIRSTTAPPYMWTRLFCDLEAWRQRPEATVEPLAGSLWRIGDESRVEIVDASLGYATVVRVERPEPPAVRPRSGSAPRRGSAGVAHVLLCRDFQRLPGGVVYPAEIVVFSAPGLDPAQVDAADVPVPEGVQTTYTRVLSARTDFQTPDSLGRIAPEAGWRIADYTFAPTSTQPLEYVYRPDVTEAEKRQLYAEQLAYSQHRADIRRGAESRKGRNVGRPHPALDGLQFLSGPIRDASSLRGRVVLLDFWATWCGPCISAMPKLMEWQEKYGPEGLTVVGVSDEDASVVTRFLANRAVNYSMALSADKALWVAYAVVGRPTYAIIDRNGVVEYNETQAGGHAALEAAIVKALAVPEQGEYVSRPAR